MPHFTKRDFPNRKEWRESLRSPLGWAVLGLSLSLVLWAWSLNRSFIQERAQATFEAKLDQLRSLVQMRLLVQEEILKGAVGLFAASRGDVTRQAWNAYFRQLDLQRNFPGIEGLGFARSFPPDQKERVESEIRREGLPGFRVVPEGLRPEMTAIVYLEPFGGRNLRAIGFDMYSEPVRREAMVRARDSGTTALSGRVTLVQEGDDGPGRQSGFLIYLPVYRPDAPVGTVEQRRAALLGFVYSPFRAGDLLSALALPSSWKLDFEVYDGMRPDPENLMYDSDAFPHWENREIPPLFEKTFAVEFYGNTWTFHAGTPPGFVRTSDWHQPRYLLLGGLAVSFLLFGITCSLTSTRLRAERLAEGMTLELRRMGESLEVRVDERTRQLQVANRAISESEERLRTALWASGTGTFRWYMDGDRIEGDWSFYALLGAPENPGPRYLGEWMALVQATDREAFLEAFELCRRADSDLDREFPVLDPSGKERWLLIRGKILRSGKGEPRYMTGACTDITERKSAEKELLAQTRALEENEEKLRQAQKMEAIGRLAGGIAHDFNNLLTAINGYASLSLAQLEPSHPLHVNLEEIGRAGQRAASLTMQLLAYSRRQMLAPKIVNLNAVVSDLDRMLKRLIGENILAETHLQPDLGWIKVDPTQLQQVIINLALNARDAMPAGGRLTFTTSSEKLLTADPRGRVGEAARTGEESIPPGEYAVLSVADTGTGMDKAVLDRLFEPYFTTKTVGKGTGLGLSTVYGIIRQSGGFIQVYSEPMKGTEFRIYLPTVPEPLAPSPDAAGHKAQHLSRGNETILIAEDEVVVGRLLRDILARAGYEVLLAKDGEEALKASQDHAGRLDLLITDVVMPRMGGRELAERLLATRPATAVVYMSGYSDDNILRQDILEEGVVFVQKPFSPSELTRTIRRVLDGLGLPDGERTRSGPGSDVSDAR